MITILFVVLIISILAAGYFFFRWDRCQVEVADVTTTAEMDQARFKRELASLHDRILQLSKYQTIVDAEKRAEEIRTEAEALATKLLAKAKGESEELLKSAKEISDKALLAAAEVRAEAAKQAQEKRESAEKTMHNAVVQAQTIIVDAHKKAESIAGDAYAALQNADQLEKTAIAMKNIIEGYGDRYLVASYTLLDGLSDEYGHEQAGQELKQALERSRMMVRVGTAAKCEYVEINRRVTAINFVLDAFNGKVDSIISQVKRDNAGTLAQKVKDAFVVVNNNGKAFRDAAITPEYLDARLKELRCAAIVQELKWQEREEQRIIKEQIREEDKARREYERAIKEAEKEEDMLKKAIEKAQQAIDKASEEQKATYEAKLNELNDKLQAAEAKNQRALSMAQQTKSGHVYIISNIGSFGEDVYKIGLTRRLEPLDRIKELGDSSVPFDFDVHALIFNDNAPSFERELHKHFLRVQMNKVNPRKEFFRASLKEIREEIEALGISAKWTMTAEAREYRESLSIEQALRENNLNQAEWEKHQMEIMPEETEEA